MENDKIDFYRTPKVVAALMTSWLNVEPGDTVLDPSCGDGALIKAVHKEYPHPMINYRMNDLYEGAKDLIIVKDDPIYVTNFLAINLYNEVSRIILNPPFKDDLTITHIQYAFNHNLKFGGRMVALTNSDIFDNPNTEKRKDFVHWVIENASKIFRVGIVKTDCSTDCPKDTTIIVMGKN